MIKLNIKDIKTARQCMDFQNIKCKNNNCLNLSCPLNIKYDKEFKNGN